MALYSITISYLDEENRPATLNFLRGRFATKPPFTSIDAGKASREKIASMGKHTSQHVYAFHKIQD